MILAEFGGTVDTAVALTRMAEEILYWRSRMKQIAEVVAKVQTKEPFAVIGAGPDLYSSARWMRIRQHQLREHPLCKYSAETGIVEPATICDHVEPHHGDLNKFWNGPFQSLCKRCHDSAKRHVEIRGYRPDIGLDGWPLDRRHPVYARGR